MISNTNKSSYYLYHNMAIRGPKGSHFEDFGNCSNTKIGKILNNGLHGVKMGTQMLRGRSLKSSSLLRTFYPPQIMILPDSELKLSK